MSIIDIIPDNGSTSFNARSGMTITINSVTITDLGNGYSSYLINYTQTNLTNLAIDEGTLKLFFTNAVPLQQYGFFGVVYPGENFSVTRSYEFTTLSSSTPSIIQYDNDHFFSDNPISGALQFKFFGNELAHYTQTPPIVGLPLNDQLALEDGFFSYSLQLNSFLDNDFGDSLSYSATQLNGSPLPNWLSFNQTNLTFSGIPTNNDVGTLNIKVTAIDSAGAYVSDQFVLVVNNTNDAPTLANAIADQVAVEDRVFNFVVPENTFADVDTGDELHFSAFLVNASGEFVDSGTLPSWLSFNESTRTFSGTPLQSDVGTLHLKVIATDNANANVSEQFSLVIRNTNDAPTGSVSISGVAIQGQTLTTTNTLADEDGLGVITYQWLRGGKTVVGANSDTYSVTDQDVGQGLSVQASYTDSFGIQEKVVSKDVLFVLPEANINSQPVKGTVRGTLADDVFDGSQTPTAILSGGKGNDTYLIDNSSTKIKEVAKQGTDTVFSSISFNLPKNVENLSLIGEDNINGTGNNLNNVLIGNSGNNILSGLTGNDILTGNGGSDRFVFDTKYNKNNIDTLTDFTPGEDIIALSTKIFKKLGSSVDISDVWFKASGETQGKTGLLVYDADTGILAYDADGSGKGKAVQIALIGITDHPELQATDFMMI